MADEINNNQELEGGLPEPKSFGSYLEESPIKVNPLSAGKAHHFSAPDLGRYLTYGSQIYGKLGYNPFRDNSEHYNDNTSASVDLQRAWDGMWKLAGVGWSDTFGFGMFGAEDNHKDFEQIMSDYSSTRGGKTQFWSNAMLSSGYTVGIIGAIAAEELLYAGATVLSGGLAAPGTLPAMGASIGRGVHNLNRGLKAIDKVTDASRLNVFKRLRNIEDARLLNGIGEFGSHFRPLGNTTDWIRSAGSMQDLNGLQKVLGGAGALARDARKIYVTHSESRLEANMVREEIIEKRIDDWHKKNPGQMMTESVYKQIADSGDDAYSKAYGANMKIIYLTNAITFNGLFKGFSRTNRLFNMANGYRVAGMGTKDILVSAVPKTVKNWAKQKLSSITFKGTTVTLAQQSMEGVQEVSQDIISSAAKRYVNFQEDRFGNLLPVGDLTARGNYYKNLYASLGDSSWETFFTGAVMGIFASPVNIGTKMISEYTVGEKNQIWTEKGRIAQEEKFKQREKQAEVLTRHFRESGNFLDEHGKKLYMQINAQEKMLQAAEEGNRKYFEDNRGEIFRIGLESTLKNGLEKEYIAHLKEMSGYTVEELNDATGRTDITEDNKGEFLEKMDKYIDRIKNYRKKYDELQQEINPQAYMKLDPKSPDYMKRRIQYKAFEDLRTERLYTEDKIYETKQRLSDVMTFLTKKGKMTESDISVLLTTDSVGEEIATLETKVKSDKEYNIKRDPAEDKKLESLKNYKKALAKYEKADENTPEEQMEKTYWEMFQAYNNYVNLVDESLNEVGGNRLFNKTQFEHFYDYLGLKEDRKFYEKYAQTLMDPELSSNHLNRIEGVLQEIEDNKKQHILKSLEVAERRDITDSLVGQLLEHDLVFDMNEVDDLMEKGIMPSKIYNINTHEEATPEEYAIAQKFAEMAYKNLTGKKIMSSDQFAKGRKKTPSDKRKSSTLINKFARGKEDTPIKLSTFIRRLLTNNKHLTNPEREILLKLQEVDEGKVVLTRKGETPISVNDEGHIVIDVRHSGSDYIGGTTPFESMAISAVLQAHYAEQLKEDEELLNQTQELMTIAGRAFAARENMSEDVALSLPLFSDPAVFLSESLNNWGFQNFLADVEDTSQLERRSIWERFTDVLEKVLNRMGFRGSLLDRALNLSQLALTEEKIEAIEEEESVPVAEEPEKVTEEEEIEEEVDEPITLEDKRKAINDKIKSLQEERNELKKEKDELKFYQWAKRIELNNDILSIEALIIGEEMSLEKLEKQKEATPEIMPDTEIKGEVKVVKDNNNNLAINSKTPFEVLDQKLKEQLAVAYVKIYKKDATPENAEEAVKLLEPADIEKIQGLMGKATMGEIIFAYNKEEAKKKAPITFDVEGIEPVEEKESVDILSTDVTGKELRQMLEVSADIESLEVFDTFASELNSLPTREEKLDYLFDLETLIAKQILQKAKTEKKDEPRIKITQEEYDERVAEIEKHRTAPVDGSYGGGVKARLRQEASADKMLEELNSKYVVGEVSEKIDTKLMNSNWKLLTPQATFDYNGNKFSLKPIDIAILRVNNIGIFNVPKEEFVQRLYEFTQNSTNQANIMDSENYLRTVLEGKTEKETQSSLEKEIKRLRSVNALSSKTINVLKKHLASINHPLTIKVRKGQVSYTMVSGVQKRSLGVNITQKLQDFFYPEPGAATSIQMEYLVYKWLQDNTVAPTAMPVREKRNYVRANSKNKTADGIADIIFEEWQDELNRLRRDGVDIVNDVLAKGERKTLQRYFKDEYRNALSEEDRLNELYEQYQLEIEEAQELSDIADIREFEQSTAFEILSGLFEGDPTTLSSPERKLYEEVYGPIKDDFIPPSDLTPLEAAASEMDKELSSMHIDQGNRTYIHNAIRKINSPESELIEILAVNQAITNGLRSFSPAQLKRINLEASRAITDPNYEGKVISIKSDDSELIPSGAYKIIPAMQQGAVMINLLNLETKVSYSLTPTQVLNYADNVLEDESVFSQSDLNTDFEDQDLTDLKTDYSEIFSNFSNNMSEFSDASTEVLTQQIFDELNKCK
jgi:hypothetical protein